MDVRKSTSWGGTVWPTAEVSDSLWHWLVQHVGWCVIHLSYDQSCSFQTVWCMYVGCWGFIYPVLYPLVEKVKLWWRGTTQAKALLHYFWHRSSPAERVCGMSALWQGGDANEQSLGWVCESFSAIYTWLTSGPFITLLHTCSFSLCHHTIHYSLVWKTAGVPSITSHTVQYVWLITPCSLSGACSACGCFSLSPVFIFIRSNTFVVALTAKLFIGLTICQTRANGTAPKQVRLLEIQQAEHEEQLGCSSGGPPCPWQQLNFPVFSTSCPPPPHIHTPTTTYSNRHVLLCATEGEFNQAIICLLVARNWIHQSNNVYTISQSSSL